MPGYINNPVSVISAHTVGVFDRIAFAYQEFAYRVFGPNTYHPYLVAVCYSLLMLLSVVLCSIFSSKQLSMLSNLLLIILLAVISFAVCLVTFIANNTTHQLILLSLDDHSQIWQRSAQVLIGIIVWCNTIFAHHVYLNKSLIAKQTSSLMTRIATEIESQGEYRDGLTPVYFIGYWEDSKAALVRQGFEHTKRGFGLGYSTSIEMRVSEHISSYYKKYMGSGMNVSKWDTFTSMTSELRELINQMLCFPAKGYCLMIDGAIYVKISDLNGAHVLLNSSL